MFRGASKVTLDSKGRMAIPSRYRERLISRSEGKLVVTVDRDHCLLIYPLPDWEKVQRKLDALPSFNKMARETQRLMVGYATDVELDGHGRILLSKALCEFAALDKQAMLLGQTNRFELWDEDRWNQRQAAWGPSEDPEGADMPPELKTLTL